MPVTTSLSAPAGTEVLIPSVKVTESVSLVEPVVKTHSISVSAAKPSCVWQGTPTLDVCVSTYD